MAIDNKNLPAPVRIEDFKTEVVAVEILNPDGSLRRALPYWPLTWEEFNDIEKQIPEPRVPSTRQVGDKKLPNPDDDKYRKEKAEVEMKRAYLRMLLSLEKAGNDVRRGDTVEEQIANVSRIMDIYDVNALMRIQAMLINGGQARILDRAASFPGEPVPGEGDAG